MAGGDGGGDPVVGYAAEARADGPVYGTGDTVSHVLGTFRADFPGLVLRWLRGEALRIADRLDPDPARSSWAWPALRVVTAPFPDCPSELRVWATDPTEQRAAGEHLRSGCPVIAAFPDADCMYTLSVRPVRLPADDSCRAAPALKRQRVGGLSHPLYALTEDPWT
ncbi:hypothetical protein OG909_14875 [Streptomyces sp. NBC_01754]|uniref:hypothetical protein n=1 Tax=Streptomyces sp. NBC_01754 TaxID=2975930 RepID=UPI002DDB70D9|nr:hypothetical protein [Streptomyces sp. NBC_01754]WSC93464.1 hypothetical protein OG909_14875 [Streptomyces sp. NBC_01754]